MAEAEHKSQFNLSKPPYLSLTSELWDVYCEDVAGNWPCNNRMAWQWAETLVEIRGTLVDIRGTTK